MRTLAVYDANTFAYLALVLFVPVSIVALRLFRPARAVSMVFVGAALFLPARVSFNFEGFPSLDKGTIPVFCVFLSCLLFYRQRFATIRLLRGVEVLVLVLILTSMGTALTNGDALAYGSVRLPNLKAWDIVSMASHDLLRIGLPFLFGTIFFRTTRDLADLLRVIVIFALIYIPLIVLEVALSPQLHKWVYGFHQHGFQMGIRFGGYRPSVFMANGLAVGLYIYSATLAAVGLARIGAAVLQVPTTVLAPVLGIVLIVCKSVAAICYFLATVPVAMLCSPLVQLRVAMILAVLVASYPVLRATDLFPVEQLVALGTNIDEERAQSIGFRFDNEKLLLVKAMERPVFGWGGFDRNRVFENDRDVTITDGFWIIQLGSRGFMGFTAAFGLLLLPIFIMARRIRYVRGKDARILIGALALILAVYCVDLLPNGLFTTLPYLLAGALIAQTKNLARRKTHVKRGVVSKREAEQSAAGSIASQIIPLATSEFVMSKT